MGYAEKVRAAPRRHRPAAEPESRTSGLAAQDRTKDRAIARGRLADSIDNSPRTIAQRSQARGVFGECAQLQGALELDVSEKSKSKDDEDADFKALEEEAAAESDAEGELIPRDGGVYDDLIEDESVDPTTEEGVALIKDALDGLFLEMDVYKVQVEALHEELLTLDEANAQWTLEDIDEFADLMDQAEQVSAALASPMGREEPVDESEIARSDAAPMSEEDSQLAELEAQLDAAGPESIADFLLSSYEANLDRILQIGEQLAVLEAERQDVRRQITGLQLKLGILAKEEASGVSYKTGKNAKKGAQWALMGTKYLAPVLAAPIEIAETALAIVSTARTIKHIVNLRKLRQLTQDPRLRDIIQYAIRQKTQKAAKKGLKSLGAGIVATAYGAGKSVYKRVRGTRGAQREANARELVAAAGRDPDAASVVRELVGADRMNEAVQTDDGWRIVFDKLASK